MSRHWYVESEGQVQGPFSSRELREQAAAGKLRPTDNVSPDGQKWAVATKIKGLSFSGTSPDPAATVVAAMSPSPHQHASSSQAAIATTDTEQIPGYEMRGVLGKGACGIVFRAKQVKLDRIVALKMVLTESTPTPAALARFDKEAVSLAKLRHPNIVGVFDCGHHNGHAFFAMELLEGEDLGARIDRQGALDEFTAWHIARQTASALAHAADLGVFHRDIKPANLFLTPPPTGYPLPAGVPLVKVTDFGLAITRRSGNESTDQRLTAAGVVLGTPAYMPPEQFAGSDIDQRADIYALGASVFHMLSGDVPFRGANVWEVMLKKSEPAPRLGAPISSESVELVALMMAQTAADRVGTYRELIERIDALSFVQEKALPSPSARSQTGAPAPPARAEGEDNEFVAPRRRPKPQKKSKARLYAVAVLGGIVIAGAALGMKFLGNKQGPVTEWDSTKKEFGTGDREELFDRNNVIGWQGQGWSTAPDSEGTSILTGEGTVRRPFKPPAHFRLVLGLDPFNATSAEVVVATAEGSARQWSIRLSRTEGASFGVRESESGSFRPLGPTVPVPEKDEDKVQYGEVRYERAGGHIRAFYLNRPLGEIEDTGLAKTTDVKILAEGGPIRIDTAALEELIEKR
ncbi:MAG TPA: protein kinase [Gemmata sp.]